MEKLLWFIKKTTLNTPSQARERIYPAWLFKKEYQGQDVAGALVDYVIAQAKSENFSELSLGVDLDNSIARHLYEKKDFTTILFRGKDKLGEYVKLLKKL